MRARYLLRVALVGVTSALTAPVFAEFSPTNVFPEPFYYSLNTGFYFTPFGLVTLEGLRLSSPTGPIPAPAAPGGAVWGGFTFDAHTFMSFFGGPTVIDFNPGQTASASITGVSDVPPVHLYDTEMLSLNLTSLPGGPGVTVIREDPLRPSIGERTAVDVPGGFQVASFFDVFTELSLDGGDTWTPATTPVRIINPEPGSLFLFACAAVPLIARRRREV